MDPESWKMAATNFKEQGDMTVPRTMQVNHTKYLPTETLRKRRAAVMVNNEPAKMEGRFLHVDVKPSYKNSLNSVDQREMKRTYGEERMIVMSKRSVNAWAYQVPGSLGHRENVALISCGNNIQNSKTHYGLECKRFPTLKRDITRTFIPKQEKANFQVLREDVKINASTCMDSKALIHEVPGEKTNVKMEPILVEDDDDDDETEGSNLYPEISFHSSHKKIMGTNVNYQSGRGEQLHRNKLSGQVSSMCTEERVHQKMLSSHRMLYRDLPSASGEFTPNDSSVSSIQRMKFTSSSRDESKGQHSVSQKKEKSAGNTKFRRFLLIDSQGLPYTVVVEESKTTKDSNSTSESFSDIKNAAAPKSVAPRKIYKCPVCFRIFEYLSYLQRHSIAHSQQKPHVCKICGKAFKRTSHLTRHKYTHFGGKPSQCQICHRRFRDIGELNRHQLSHTGERPYQCEVCYMRFGEHSTLQHHMLAKH